MSACFRRTSRSITRVSGPDASAAPGCSGTSGRDDPYSVYDKLDFEIPVGKGLKGTVGDCWDRYMVRVHEMEQSVNIIEQAVEKIPAGDVQAAIPKRIRPDAGEVYVRTETPKGELGYYIVSDGTASPFRVKVQGPVLRESLRASGHVPRRDDCRRRCHPRQHRHRARGSGQVIERSNDSDRSL